MAKITVRTIEAAKPKDKEYKLTVDRGLYLRVATDGTKTWLVRYVVDGHQRQARLPLPYGTSGIGCMSLADAIVENARIQGLARAHIDFQRQAEDERRMALEAQQAAEAANKTFREMYEAWLKNGVARSDANKEIIRTFEKDIIPAIGDKPVRDITSDDLRDVLKAVHDRGVNRLIVQLLADLRQLFRWAQNERQWRRLLIEGDPTKAIKIETLVDADYDLSNVCDRVLSVDEVIELHKIFLRMDKDYKAAKNKTKVVRPVLAETQLAIWICLSTLCRIGELLQAEWRHLDFEKGEWFIPAENVKGKRGKKQSLMVFLSPFTLDKFQALRALTGDTDWCFPARDDAAHCGLRYANF